MSLNHDFINGYPSAEISLMKIDSEKDWGRTLTKRTLAWMRKFSSKDEEKY